MPSFNHQGESREQALERVKRRVKALLSHPATYFHGHDVILDAYEFGRFCEDLIYPNPMPIGFSFPEPKQPGKPVIAPPVGQISTPAASASQPGTKTPLSISDALGLKKR